MKLLTLADLHLDLYLGQQMNPFEKVPAEQLEGITHCVIAGDLSNKAHKRWSHCLPWLADRLPNAQIFVMPGNHDYYDGSIDREEKLREVAAANNASFVQKSELIYGANRFLCCTLWTDFDIYGDRAEGFRRAASHMNDYHYIRFAAGGYRKLTPAQTAQIHSDHRKWLDERLSEPFEGETTVITHHAPHINALKDAPSMGPCYASDLESLILKHQPDRWLYGHTHHRVSFSIGKTIVKNVSIGYPGQLPPIDSLKQFTCEFEE
ncbi:putative phosphohydrolase [Sulfitobacter undariae]|uniref:Putative phosphohydrolase n=1 Tax=Sulfitobacter undariae TaxID=1563671 RepID=A0A7W6E872_9RHOB|nr:metallophosphoesterase [Sulfitobacter undariae]MBB3995994.1 putative phosphohydrolase [Sulfitobacter undariae]